MKEKNGHFYDIKSFEDYKYRAKFEVVDINGNQLTNFDIYTTNPARNEVEKLFQISSSKIYPNKSNTKSGIIHWTTKEQDDLTGQFIGEFFK